MPTLKPRNTNSSNRFHSPLVNLDLTKKRPEKHLSRVLKKQSGRDSLGKVSTRHQGGRHKRLLREIEWKRRFADTSAVVKSIEYDPNRSVNIALLHYSNGHKSYILAPDSLKSGDKVETGPAAEVKTGNCLPLANIPIGTPIHNIELTPGKGAQIVRSAGSAGYIQSKDHRVANVLLPSREVRLISVKCYATIGQLSNLDWKNVKFGKAGRKRNMGIRPTVRGTAQHPDSHPHGGGEGRSGEGMPPKTPWGKSARGTRTRKKTKYSDGLIIKRRN